MRRVCGRRASSVRAPCVECAGAVRRVCGRRASSVRAPCVECAGAVRPVCGRRASSVRAPCVQCAGAVRPLCVSGEGGGEEAQPDKEVFVNHRKIAFAHLKRGRQTCCSQ